MLTLWPICNSLNCWRMATYLLWKLWYSTRKLFIRRVCWWSSVSYWSSSLFTDDRFCLQTAKIKYHVCNHWIFRELSRRACLKQWQNKEKNGNIKMHIYILSDMKESLLFMYNIITDWFEVKQCLVRGK